MTVSEKQNYLNRYFYAMVDLQDMKDESQEYIESIMSCKKPPPNIIKANKKKTDLSSVVAEISVKRSELTVQAVLCDKLRTDTIKAIESLKSQKQREVMYLRYVRLMEWNEIEKYYKWCYKLHNRALKAILLTNVQ